MQPLSPAANGAITVIGDGLAGTLLALSLAHRGVDVHLIGAGQDTATALSYGALPRGLAAQAWRGLEGRHGPLGFHPSGLVLHECQPGLVQRLAALTQWLPLPLARIDTPTWMAARQKALAAVGVRQLCRRLVGLQPSPEGGWLLDSGPDGPEILAQTVVLAAGAGSRILWPALPLQLRHSWAGVLLVGPDAPNNPWLAQARRGRVVQPRRWQRPALEAGSAESSAEARWIVDAGLAPWGDSVVVGQISWIPGLSCVEPPDPLWMEERLRDGLRQLDPVLAKVRAAYRQVPVSFCSNGQPLAGPVQGAPGLWIFAGFSGAFSQMPSQAEALSTRLLAEQREEPPPWNA